ncbi:MAG: hypothetical protein COV30_02290 [Candidatus Yanofskybacteria bacterium CG10_big_fil_rev_8_21_14_0_10_37_15]|uniref:DUF3105 domain-containing protein n=1 Tax=Candidatus Yanofskybacteria bacterium CG10_big_fil_rev_8_21_14_0_10_37_15 TaxID=1975097 RepID=A0A2H0R5U2_9BACT|nr:MAG: hypothetical protein COV30_02290 [Candidatus Yanofskybacteria bacterium CG10_big_fil_rev_8_21_14_0_10_37_15]
MENQNLQNEYFLKRETKEKEIQFKKTKKIMKRFVIWVILLIIVGFIFWMFILPAFKTVSIPEVRGNFYPAQNREHIAIGAPHPEYNSDPPTGGWHYNDPVQTGIYDEEFPDEQLIHNLEHGHIWIAYKPDLDVETIEKLAEIAKSYGSKIIMTPRSKNNVLIAVTAWEYLLELNGFDEGQILGFIKAYRGRGPENIPDFGFKDFRIK